jgi:uncharacterized membrane protein YkoI
MRKRLSKTVLGLAALTAFALGGAAIAAGGDDPAPSAPASSGGARASAYSLDDGGSLQSKAAISIDDAVAAATASATGDVGEIDLEDYQGTLVYNIDVGKSDVKVDASNGDVLGAVQDDEGGADDEAAGEESGDDGPGGHADEPGNANADHENEGSE